MSTKDGVLNPVIIVHLIQYYFARQCCGLNIVDLPGFDSEDSSNAESPLMTHDRDKTENEEPPTEYQAKETKKYPPIRVRKTTSIDYRKYRLVSNPPETNTTDDRPTYTIEDDKDDSIKNKISTLVNQTIHDTESKIKGMDYYKEQNRDKAPYKIGFILSMVKKSKDVLNELFNVAVKHRDEWKALEQLKLFELIVNTNVETTNFVRQMVEIHVQNLNATKFTGSAARRVITSYYKK